MFALRRESVSKSGNLSIASKEKFKSVSNSEVEKKLGIKEVVCVRMDNSPGIFLSVKTSDKLCLQGPP